MEKINWAICDDAEYLCISFRGAFENESDIHFVGEAHNSVKCVEMVRDKKPDILLLDIQMETEKAGIELVPTLKKLHPGMKIIMLTSYDDENYIFSAFANGADDYVIKTLSNQEILDTIRCVYKNTSMLRPDIAQKLTRRSQEIQERQKSILYMVNIMTKLSTSEFEVLKAAYFGDSYKQIAMERFVDISTVRTLASRVIKKFGATSLKNLIDDLTELKIFELFDK